MPGSHTARRSSAAERGTRWLRSIISGRSSSRSDDSSSEDLSYSETKEDMVDGLEVLVPYASDVHHKYIWNVRKFGRSLDKYPNSKFDSDAFELYVNGLRTRWNLSLRFWTGPDGVRVRSPVVACLNLLSCYPSDNSQASVRFQFGVYNQNSGRFELEEYSHSMIAMADSKQMISIGHQDVAIVRRHLEPLGGNIRIICNMQVIPSGCEEGHHSLAQDMNSLMCNPVWARCDVTLRAIGGKKFTAHSCILAARSPRFTCMLENNSDVLEFDDLTPEILKELLRYVYTGTVEDIDRLAPVLLAASTKYELPGLTHLCERYLLGTMDTDSVASRLLLADEFGCEALKRAALAYCEGYGERMPKSVAWSVMEMVNPHLFRQACEAGLSMEDSTSSFGSSSFSEACSLNH